MSDKNREMSDSTSLHHLPQDWEVPSYQVKYWLGRRHSYCVVIPVINEGTRVGSLLQRMLSLEIHGLADIVIVDGGSVDGSLIPEKLKADEVRGLLAKTGSGTLSSQLRCAYYFALQQGYEGIITIDGNDKDDPEAIPKFISALCSGFDFVQASRFLPEGLAVNTPLSRDIAIRFLHAPLLRLASGFHWTDTTQGYRAYSRKMLTDPKIAPFRSIFTSYELLAYLSYRAPRLGYRCIELPTKRRYPAGKVPTKISRLGGNWAVFCILISACLGRYNPERFSSGSTRYPAKNND